MEALPDQEIWRFLLGNTLLRMLGHISIHDSRSAAWWRSAAGTYGRATTSSAQTMQPTFSAEKGALPAGVPGSTESQTGASEGSGEGQDECEDAAAEMAVVMMSELLARQSPHTTRRMMTMWASGELGAVRKQLTDMELLHARAAGLRLSL